MRHGGMAAWRHGGMAAWRRGGMASMDARRYENGNNSASVLAPRVSIVIPLFNRVLFTQVCMRALAATVSLDQTEVLFVDNGSTDGTAAFLAALPPPFHALHNPTNDGFARACNRGAAVARGQYVLFLNNDTVPQPGWLDALLAALPALAAPAPGPAPAIIGARLLFPDDTVQHAGIGFNARDEPVHRAYGASLDDATALRSCPVPAVTGACLLMERARFLALGGFDEGYRNGFEDLDLCCRVRQGGGIVWYAAESTLYHFESASAGRYSADEANYRRFRARWADWLATDPLAQETIHAASGPVRLNRTYATGADTRRELDRVIADAAAFTAEFARLDAAYQDLTAAFARQETWAQSLETDARRVRARARWQRLVGRLLGI